MHKDPVKQVNTIQCVSIYFWFWSKFCILCVFENESLLSAVAFYYKLFRAFKGQGFIYIFILNVQSRNEKTSRSHLVDCCPGQDLTLCLVCQAGSEVPCSGDFLSRKAADCQGFVPSCLLKSVQCGRSGRQLWECQ